MNKLGTILLSAAAIVGATIATMRADVGDIYLANFVTGQVYRISPTGVKSVFVSGLTSPSGLAFDSLGNLYASDYAAGAVDKVTSAGVRTTFVSGLNKPYGLAVDASGNVFEADNGSNAIFKITSAGAKTVFANGLNHPAGLVFDPSGNLFESDFGSGTIYKFAAGKRSTFATGLSAPDDMATDALGDLYVANSGAGQILKFTPAGVKSTYATGFNQPAGVALDKTGNLFVTDNATGILTKITPAGTRSAFASALANPQYLAIQPPTRQVLNISTRSFVETGENVMIAGFIVGPAGSGESTLLVRAIGPSLVKEGVANPLPDPTLEILSGLKTLAANDDWKQTQDLAITATGLAPADDKESAILITLPAGAYTAVVRGKGSATGVGLVEVYKLL